ncbi:MAG: esterase-like activity of phytase family protein, partial [Kamptonema sp. SIO4C4]|nr:esterase-like activity of phytase family protein [Kamptonema sp. SIO4C4]
SQVTLENVTTLKNEQGETYPENGIDPESIALSPRDTLYISSEGIPSDNIPPFLAEFDRETGQKLSELRIPKRFLPNTPIRNDNPPHGVQENLGFEALALGITSVAEADPFRLFTAPEFSLIQDDIEHTPDTQPRLRLLHYGINPVGPPILVSETLYLLEPIPETAISHGLTELIALQREGYLLSLERSFSPLAGVTAQLFQVTSGNATDTSRIDNLKSINIVEPMRKQLLFDLTTLDIPLDNLEGMALGPYFPDGSQSLIFVSDDNFRDEQVTQFLIFSLKER